MTTYEQLAIMMQLLNNQIFFNVPLQGDDIQDFDKRWDQAPRKASEILKENVLESLYKLKIRDSVQFQTVLAMYEPEIDRDRAMPIYQRLKKLIEDTLIR